MEAKKCSHHGLRNHLTFGVLVILLGVVLLGLNFGFIPAALRPALISWAMLLVVLGLLSLVRAHFFRGIIFLILGAFFLVPKLYLAYPCQMAWAGENFTQVYYPLLLIAGGVLFIVYMALPARWKRRHFWHSHSHYSHHCTCGENCTCGKKCTCGDDCQCGKADKGGKKGGNCGCLLDKNVIFAGCDEIFLEEVFHGGELNTVFGGVNLDLRRTSLPEGDTHLEINAVFGGVKLYVPDTWYIELRTDNVCAGVADNRLIDPEKIDKSRRLVIRGSLVFGGAELTN
ncbi:MAG: cell wall-active antibiotics response protein [Candidatus Symbiothrix sp.]|jgi:predicted membrane protein|nr:cell wall-active antibiotics response protein [Candidatus Symbiothrix sp.]